MTSTAGIFLIELRLGRPTTNCFRYRIRSTLAQTITSPNLRPAFPVIQTHLDKIMHQAVLRYLQHTLIIFSCYHWGFESKFWWITTFKTAQKLAFLTTQAICIWGIWSLIFSGSIKCILKVYMCLYVIMRYFVARIWWICPPKVAQKLCHLLLLSLKIALLTGFFTFGPVCRHSASETQENTWSALLFMWLRVRKNHTSDVEWEVGVKICSL